MLAPQPQGKLVGSQLVEIGSRASRVSRSTVAVGAEAHRVTKPSQPLWIALFWRVAKARLSPVCAISLDSAFGC
jgi:hypothetical protein